VCKLKLINFKKIKHHLMAINLQKGQTIDLRKNDKGESFDLSKVTIGLGWDIRSNYSSGADYDLDAIAFVLDSNKKIANLGRTVLYNGNSFNLVGSDIIFYHNQKHPSGHIKSTGDNRTGAGDGDDEQIIVHLDSLSHNYQSIVFLVTIYQGKQNNQHFGMISNAFIRAVDARGKEIARFSLSSDATYNGMCSMTFAEVYRKDGTWKFRAIGDPTPDDNFGALMPKYS
jgi:tellurium resistance protein TerD